MRWVTAREVAGVMFTSKWFRPGYDEREVDEFLDRCEATIADQCAYIAELEAQLDEARRAVGWPASDEPVPDYSDLRPEPVPRPRVYPELSPEALAPPTLTDVLQDGSADHGWEPAAATGIEGGAAVGRKCPERDAAADLGHPDVPDLAEEIGAKAEAYLAEQHEFDQRAAQLEDTAAVIRMSDDEYHALSEGRRRMYCHRNGLEFVPIVWAGA